MPDLLTKGTPTYPRLSAAREYLRDARPTIQQRMDSHDFHQANALRMFEMAIRLITAEIDERNAD